MDRNLRLDSVLPHACDLLYEGSADLNVVEETIDGGTNLNVVEETIVGSTSTNLNVVAETIDVD